MTGVAVDSADVWQAGEAGQLPTMEALLGRYVSLEGAKKLGEGTYGEAFKAGGIVFKIVPIEGACLVNGFPQTQAFQILAEASISLALSGLRHSGPSLAACSSVLLAASLGVHKEGHIVLPSCSLKLWRVFTAEDFTATWSW